MARRDTLHLDPPPGDRSRAGAKVRIRGERGVYTVVYESTDATVPYIVLFGGAHKQYRTPAATRVIWPRPTRSKP